MSNRQRLIDYLTTQPIPPKLKMDLDHFMNVDREDPEEGDLPYDLADAFNDAMDFGEDNRDIQLVKICRYILIQLGYYVPMTQRDIDNTYVTRGTVWDFKIKGVPFRHTTSFGEWLEK